MEAVIDQSVLWKRSHPSLSGTCLLFSGGKSSGNKKKSKSSRLCCLNTAPLPFVSTRCSIMVLPFLASRSLWGRKRRIWKILPRAQHLSECHIDSGALDVPAAHCPVFLGQGLHHRAGLQCCGWATALHLHWCLTSRRHEDTRDSVVPQAALAGHYHHVSAAHVHGSGRILSTEAPQEEDGGLSKTITQNRNLCEIECLFNSDTAAKVTSVTGVQCSPR